MTFDPRAEAQRIAAATRQGATGKAKARGNSGTQGQPQAPPASSVRTMMESVELMTMHFPEIRWTIPPILCEGLSITAGKPKLGKSWMTLDRGIAVSTGGLALGHYLCEPGEVLILALEDSLRRLKDRLCKLGFPGHPDLTLSTKWPRLDEGCIEKIERWLDEHKRALLVEIDTLAKIRSDGLAAKDKYQADSDALRELHRIANERRITIDVVHHLRKTPADDWVDEISGTAGIGGVPDMLSVLKRERGQADAFLFGTGRDIEDYELALKFAVQVAAGVVDAAGVAKYSPHDFRHFTASWLIDQGFGPKRIMTILGHASIQLTFDLYGHAFDTTEADYDRLAAGELALVRGGN